ncbi:uncharacterized protein BDW47DRAFT_112300 [Aspergillus candidus]|uniref:Uncharacterized protein n=1 Tax=Aspergillus candidus TaxID=41067 RepID=A0A2I2F1E9_ASPCN|nr:hypothetical protein BDW47DRAFT_112300 [Aspergillus candidus]PLB34451.1 hypothetical protein BDW47DRAFT_112300 [Aspergillus candidus]
MKGQSVSARAGRVGLISLLVTLLEFKDEEREKSRKSREGLPHACTVVIHRLNNSREGSIMERKELTKRTKRTIEIECSCGSRGAQSITVFSNQINHPHFGFCVCFYLNLTFDPSSWFGKSEAEVGVRRDFFSLSFLGLLLFLSRYYSGS